MFTIRLATTDDIETLVRIRVQFLAELGHLNEGAAADEVAEAFRRYALRKMPAGEFMAWVAEADGRVVATSGLTFFERPPNATNPAGLEAYLSNMYTLPGWRGRGMAAALVSAAVEHVKRTPARRVWLHATDEGRRVYEKAGFVASETDMELVW